MTLDPNANPGRRLTQARRRRQKLAVADLLSERFSRDSTAIWWPTPRSHQDAEVMTYMQELPDEDRELQERRLLELTAAVQDEEEASL